ncbi:hypothetical protein IC582_023751 [Cucumis melo]
MFVVHDNNVEEEIIEEEDEEPKELNMFELEGGVNTVVELSINSVVGLTNPRTMKVRGKLQGEEIVVLIDCGATHNFISEKLVKEKKLHTKETTHYGVILGSGTMIKGKGVCENVELLLNEWKVKTDFLPLELGGVDAILGMQWLYSFSVTETDWRNLTMTFFHEGQKIIIKGDPSLTKTRVGLKSMMKAWTETDQGYLVECRAIEGGVVLAEEEKGTEVDVIPATVQNVLDNFSDIFDWPDTLPPRRAIEHPIHLKTGTDPVNSDITCKKKDGSWRFCVDYRALNNVTIPDKFPIPVIEELFDELNGANLFSKIDLKAGYHQIRMHREDIEKTTFRTHEGHYEFLVMPFGLTNAPATFQSLMNSIFRSYLRKFVLIFFDDILIYSRGMEEHIYHLELVFEVLREHKLYANKKKCSFAFQRVEYLGHIVSGQGVEVDTEKIKSIKQWPVLSNVKELRGFLGLTGYYRRFMQNYGSIAAPLTQLLKLGAFRWTEDSQTTFDRLKEAMMTLPVLALPDFSLPFEMETDFSLPCGGSINAK